MPIHNWKSVESGIFHDFHQGWSWMIRQALNGILPSDHYAVVEQCAVTSESARYEPDVVTLQTDVLDSESSGVALAAPPQTTRRMRADLDAYTAKKNIVVIRHVSRDRIVAIIELISPGNKSSIRDTKQFVTKVEDLLRREIHVMLVDLFPPSRTNPYGIHDAIWQNFDSHDPLPIDPAKSLLAVSYENHGDGVLEAYIEPLAIGDSIPDMPIFLRPGGCVMVPLEATYNSAFDAVPLRWRRVIAPETLPVISPS
jgi:Protein of unknown function (DUF4058)